LRTPTTSRVMNTKVDLHLEVGPRAPGQARHAVDGLAGDVRPDVLDQMRLLVSELVTNSVRHAGLRRTDRIGFRVLTTDSAVRVEVTDAGPGFKATDPTPTIYQDSGWGLYLVEQIADRWGVERDPQTSVWFEIDRH
jgi:anti-sigma regulatory factor (Ser/Thr protein kinase)